MDDKELLEKAARAAGIDLQHRPMFGGDSEPGYYDYRGGSPVWVFWNPLTDDGDALRLAVKLGMKLFPGEAYPYRQSHNDWESIGAAVDEDEEPDPLAATRLAIVRAAAALGEKP